MKVYKLEVIIIDFDNIGKNGIKDILEDTHYPNDCIYPDVRSIEERDIGEWCDEHLLNKFDTYKSEIKRLFKEKQ